MSKIRFKCPNCGSTNVVWDAWANWDEKTQEFTLYNSFDFIMCNDCEAEEIELIEEIIE